jgi:hypothetical protein
LRCRRMLIVDHVSTETTKAGTDVGQVIYQALP